MSVERGSAIQDWLLWLVMNFMGYTGWCCSCTIPIVLITDRSDESTEFIAGVLGLIGLAVATGFAQWMVIRWRIRQAGGWVLATPLGGIIAFLTLIALSNANKVIDDSAGILAGTLFGISLGLTQWLVLRGKVRNAAWWVLANATIWPVSIFVGAGVTTAINTDPIIVASAATLVGILTTVALAESIRGVVLLWLVYRPTDVGKKPNEIVSSAQ